MNDKTLREALTEKVARWLVTRYSVFDWDNTRGRKWEELSKLARDYYLLDAGFILAAPEEPGCGCYQISNEEYHCCPIHGGTALSRESAP